MKTAEEWFTENGGCGTGDLVEISIADIKQIQLDAYKAGMTEAAEITDETPTEYWTGLSTQAKHRSIAGVIDAILTARDNKTSI